MVLTSDKFHEAIRDDAPQIPLFVFDKAVITKDDIDVNAGFRFREAVMDNEDYCPGACCASTMDINLINENDEWSDFDFGEFTAYLGARTMHRRESRSGQCVILAGGNTISGRTDSPYLMYNGSAVQGVNEPVLAMALFGSMLFVLTSTGTVSYRYSGSGLQLASHDVYEASLSSHAQYLKKKRLSICYGHTIPGITSGLSGENCLTVFAQNYTDSYEMVPLGKFTAERPTFSTRRKLSVSATDAMEKFDKDYDTAEFTYPTDVYGLLSQVCAAAGVTLSTAKSKLTNGSVSIQKEPDVKTCTLRDLLRYIGEITGTFAKINRSGQLEMKWFGKVSMSLGQHDYTDCDVGYYDVAAIGTITRRTVGEDDVSVGSGENIFYIQNNPLLSVISEV